MGGDWVPKILLERGNNPEKGGGVDVEMKGLQLFYYLAVQLHFVCVCVCVCVGAKFPLLQFGSSFFRVNLARFPSKSL